MLTISFMIKTVFLVCSSMCWQLCIMRHCRTVYNLQ